ncbi:MAG TPA: hypothetical protein DCM68_05075 [Verrucomicrobia bacterium]|nr:hypothetical protein [Verrucomicrobiota bacterium]
MWWTERGWWMRRPDGAWRRAIRCRC